MENQEYSIIENELGGKIILKLNADGSVTSFGEHEDNADYKSYLESLNDDTETE